MDMECATVELDSTVAAVGRARRIVREYAAGMPVELVADAELLTSELVTNAVRHGRPGVRLEMARERSSLWVSVHDQGGDLPVLKSTRPDRTAVSGRGLRIVETLASSWGVVARPGQLGKAVWFRIDDPNGEPGRQTQS